MDRRELIDNVHEIRSNNVHMTTLDKMAYFVITNCPEISNIALTDDNVNVNVHIIVHDEKYYYMLFLQACNKQIKLMMNIYDMYKFIKQLSGVDKLLISSQKVFERALESENIYQGAIMLDKDEYLQKHYIALKQMCCLADLSQTLICELQNMRTYLGKPRHSINNMYIDDFEETVYVDYNYSPYDNKFDNLQIKWTYNVATDQFIQAHVTFEMDEESHLITLDMESTQALTRQKMYLCIRFAGGFHIMLESGTIESEIGKVMTFIDRKSTA